MFWGYIFQQFILNLGYALSPLLIGFMAIPALNRPQNNRGLLRKRMTSSIPSDWSIS
jgi:hypothetical protein